MMSLAVSSASTHRLFCHCYHSRPLPFTLSPLLACCDRTRTDPNTRNHQKRDAVRQAQSVRSTKHRSAEIIALCRSYTGQALAARHFAVMFALCWMGSAIS